LAYAYQEKKFTSSALKQINSLKTACKKFTKKQKHLKGLAFPITISVNEICGNYSPLSEE
jgi:methionine aminopeptidase